MKYYIAENGQPVGPFEANELLAHGLTGNSLVWGEGMQGWTSASQVPELAALLSGQPFDPGAIEVQLPPLPPVGQTAPQLPQMPPMGDQMPLPEMPQVPPVTFPQPTSPPQPQTLPQGNTTGTTPSSTTNAGTMPKTWLVESIVATVACCVCCGVPLIGLIPGAVAVFNAMGVKTCYNKGDYEGAKKKSASAKKWFYITIAVGVAAAVYGAIKQVMSNPNFMQDIENGNMGFFYGIN